MAQKAGNLEFTGLRMNPAVVFLIAMLVIASINDILLFRIPNWVTLPGLAVGLAYFSIISGFEGFLFSLMGALAGLGLLIIPYIMGGTGAGDVKLLGAVGSFLGAYGVFIVYLYSCILGGAYALFLLASKGLLLSTLKRYGNTLWCFIGTGKFIYLPPSTQEKALKVRFGVVIALGTGSYWAFGY